MGSFLTPRRSLVRAGLAAFDRALRGKLYLVACAVSAAKRAEFGEIVAAL
jgi:hypothetical protein